MPFQVSPGVSIREIDLTTTVPSVSTTDGGTVIDADWGPVDLVTLISTEQELVSIFGRPNANIADSRCVSWLGAANFLSYSNKLRVIRANSSGLNATSGAAAWIKNFDHYNESYLTDNDGTTGARFAARYPGQLGNSLRVAIADSNSGFSNAAATVANVTVHPMSTGQTAVYVGGPTGIDSEVIEVGDYISFPSNSYPSQQYRVTAIAADNETGANSITISPGLVENITVGGSPVRRDWAYASYFDSTPTVTTWGSAYDEALVENDALHVLVFDGDGGITGKRGTVLEKWAGLSKAKNAIDPETGRHLYYQDAINQGSNWIYWAGKSTEHPFGTDTEWGTTANSSAISFGVNKQANLEILKGASDPGVASAAQKILAFDKFRNTEDLDLSVIFTNDASAVVQKHVIQNIAENRKDCVVCVSPERADVVPSGENTAESALTNVLDWRNNQLVVSSSYGIADSGWKYILDKYNNKFRWIPLNSDIAGCIVRTDTENDPWFSPAGYTRGQIKNVVKLAWSPNKAQRDELYKKDVNPVVTFPGRGTVLFGDKTLYGKNSAFDRINVRRLFIVLEKAIATASKFLLFEFNDEFTRAQFTNMTEPFLRDVRGRRGITDFRVICDSSNNPASVIDRNEFVGDIYIKPARSINYIQLNFVAAATGVEFSEIIGVTS
jgi:hypothetical protein